MSITDGFQVVVAILCWLVIFRFISVLRYYVKVIWPIRKKIEDGRFVAPPATTALKYHIGVFYMIVTQAFVVIWALLKDFPLNPFTAALVPGMIYMYVMVDQFARSYAKILHDFQRDEGAVPDYPGRRRRSR